ncbi:hypothetical protein [Pseudoalteromonas piscicida]|uniref:hypothetical protein n=1 Tax=Pseudoalteromonas piscicida TaxID=43662 RepID=UPI0030A34FED
MINRALFRVIKLACLCVVSLGFMLGIGGSEVASNQGVEYVNCFPRQVVSQLEHSEGSDVIFTGKMRITQPSWQDKYFSQAKGDVRFEVLLSSREVWIEHNELTRLTLSIPEGMTLECLQHLVKSQCR